MADTFTFTQVRRVTPKGGTIEGGTPVTITGFGFDFATGGVTFGGTAATDVVIVDNATITAVTPAHNSGAVDVVVAGVGTGTALYAYQIPSTLLLPRVPVTVKNELDIVAAPRWLMVLKERVETAPVIDSGSVVGGAPLTSVNDANVTATLSGSPSDALLRAVTLTLGWTGALGVNRGGTGLTGYTTGDLLYASSALVLSRLADVSVGSYLRSGGVATAPLWSTLKLPNAATTGDLLYGSAANTISNRTIGSTGDVLTVSGGLPVWAPTSGLGTGDLTRVNDTNVTLTLGGTPTDALFKDVSITAGWTGTLAVSRGGTGTGTAFTAGSVVFAGASGVYTQDNANFFWDDSNNRLGLGVNTSLVSVLQLKGTGTTNATTSLLVEDSGGTDLFGVRDDSSIGFGKSYTLPSTTSFVYLRSGGDFSGAFTLTNNINGTANQMAAMAFQLRFAGSQEFTRAEGISSIVESSNTHAGNVLTAINASARIATAGGLATTLIGGSFNAKSDASTGATITDLIGFRASVEVNNAGVTATNVYAFRTVDLVNSGTMTNTYGVYISDVTAGTQTNQAYGLYQIDTGARNYFGGSVGLGQTAPSAVLHLKAGTATASTAPLKLTSGTSLTAAEAGAIEFTTDDYFATITTGPARKGFVLNDGANLTSGKIPIASTNGRLIDGQTPLAGAKVYYVADSSGGAVTRKLTFTDGILTAET